MIRKLLLLCAVLLSATTSFAQQDTIVNTPEQEKTDSISSDSASYQDTDYVIHIETRSHHGHRPHFQGYKAMHDKAVKRRHKIQKQKAQKKRHERIANAHKRAKARTSASRRSSTHSSHSGSHHSGSHRSGHSRGRR